MSDVFNEFQRHLAALRQRCSADPRGELLELFMLALEREELVSIGYRESLMVKRLGGMDIDERTRELIHHALIWIWKDEEMHSISIRGAILSIGSPGLRARAIITQAAGGLAGWASSILQHSRWRDAPLARTLATLIKLIGSVSGKVPADVEKHLRYGPFRGFCEFNVDAERTARVCWERIVELATTFEDMDSGLVGDFRRVVEDERRHELIFRILADALDENDRLAGGASADSLLERIREVGEEFLPRRLRRTPPEENPLGSGGRVRCARGGAGDERVELFRRLLEEGELRDAVRRRAEHLGRPLSQLRVAVKGCFMMGYERRDASPIVEPALVDALALHLRGLGCRDVALVEGRNLYDRFYRNRGVLDVATYFGFDSPSYRVVDVSEEQVPHQYSRGMAQYTISRTWKDADFRISFSKIRSHPVELAMLAVGNVESVGARCDEYLFLERQANRATAVMMLLNDFPPHFALLDGYDDVPDGLVGVMGSTRPKRLGRLYAGADALAVDTVAGRHLGIHHPRESSILRAACHWFGGWSENIEVVGCDEPVEEWRGPYSNELRAMLSFIAYPIYVLGSGRGSLFVPEMDPTAFPPLRPEGVLLRASRGFVRALLGLRLAQRR